MNEKRLLDPKALAIHIVDTLADRGVVSRADVALAVEAVEWELQAQAGMGRIVLATPA